MHRASKGGILGSCIPDIFVLNSEHFWLGQKYFDNYINFQKKKDKFVFVNRQQVTLLYADYMNYYDVDYVHTFKKKH